MGLVDWGFSEISVGDLNPGSKSAYQKVKLIVDDATTEATNKECTTNFHGLTTTKDHLCSLIRKWHTLIETFVDVKTAKAREVQNAGL